VRAEQLKKSAVASRVPDAALRQRPRPTGAPAAGFLRKPMKTQGSKFFGTRLAAQQKSRRTRRWNMTAVFPAEELFA
jgi:hypothetical protein